MAPEQCLRPHQLAPPPAPPALQVLVWVLSSVLIAGFVAFAMTTAYLRRKRLRGSMRFNQEEFITARAQVRFCLGASETQQPLAVLAGLRGIRAVPSTGLVTLPCQQPLPPWRAHLPPPLSSPLIRSPPPLPHTVQIGTLRLGWSFFAGALGAWVISGPPSYTASGFGYGAGAIGLVRTMKTKG